jgi:MFS family permease
VCSERCRATGGFLFVSRFARLFAYGSLSVILVFYLIGLGLGEAQVGLVLMLTLVGDVIVSLYLTTRADRIGRRRMLIVRSNIAQFAKRVLVFRDGKIRKDDPVVGRPRASEVLKGLPTLED